MYFLGLKILIFILVHETIAGKYYYKDKNGLYDVYYGPNSIRGYKEFKSPKSYKFDDKGDRPGKCTPGIFQCKEPFEVKETNIFECEMDYQCPSQYKCCQVSCFQHKICQPASTEDDKENEIPSVDPTVVTKLSTKISTHPVTKSTTYVKSTSPLEESSIEYFTTTEITDVPIPAAESQVRSTLETVETPSTTDNASVTTDKPVSRITEKPSMPSSITSNINSTSSSRSSTLTVSKEPHTTTTRRSTKKPRKTTLETTQATSDIYSTSSNSSTLTVSKEPHTTTTRRSTKKPRKTTLETTQTTSDIYSTSSIPSTLTVSKEPHTTTIRRSTKKPRKTTLETTQTTSNIYSTSISSTLPATRKPYTTTTTRRSTSNPRNTTLEPSQTTSDINYTSRSSTLPASRKPHSTTTTRRSTIEPRKTTLEMSQTTSNISSTPSKLSVSTTNGTTDEDVTTDDEDLTFSGDSGNTDEDISTDDDDSSGDSGGIDADISTDDDDEDDNEDDNEDDDDDDEDLTFSGDSSTLDEGADGSTLETKTTNFVTSSSVRPGSKPTPSKITTVSETTITFIKDQHTTTESSKLSTVRPSNESQTIPVISTSKSTLKTTGLFTATTKSKSRSPKLSTQKSTTRITDITSDDEDLNFSGDGDEVSIDNVSTGSHESSTESDYLKKLSSLATSFTSVKAELTSSSDRNESTNIIKTTRRSTPVSESTNISPILTTSSSEFFTSTINAVEASGTNKVGSNSSKKSTQTLSSDSTTGAAFHKLSTLSDLTKIFSSPLTSSTESIRSTEKAVETPTISSTLTVSSKSSDLPTSLGTASSEPTTTAKVNKDTISDDEDLSFSGDGAEGTSVADNITFYTSTLGNVITNVPTRVTSSKPGEKTTNAPTTENINTDYDDADDDDLIFSGSGDHQIKTTTSTVSQAVTSPENFQKNTNHDDFSFSEIGNQSTKIDKAPTEKPKSDKITTKNQPSSTETLRTKLISSTLSTQEIKVQTSLPTKLTTREQTGVTSSNEDFSTRSSDNNDLLTNYSYTMPSTISTDKSSRPYPISWTTKIPSTKLTTETGEETTIKAGTTNANEDVGNIPGGESIFVNSLLGLLRKVPTVIIGQGSSDNTDPYFSSFLQFLGRFSSLLKKTDIDIDLVNENKENSAQHGSETVAPS